MVQFSPVVSRDTVISGLFSFDTDAGEVDGSFYIEELNNYPQGVIVASGPSLSVTSSQLSGMVDDPAVEGGVRDLSADTYQTTVTQESVSNVEIRVEALTDLGMASNYVILNYYHSGYVNLYLAQASPEEVYPLCENRIFDSEDDQCRRYLEAWTGTVTFAEYPQETDPPTPIRGTFQFECEVGDVEGTFYSEG